MDFLKILRSLEEFLYEVMTWLLFYPRTLWRAFRHPIAILQYSDTELTEESDQQFVDLLSPPLFLMITILLSHAIELALHQRLPPPTTTIGKAIMNSEENLLLLRSVLFAIYPLMFAARSLKQRRIPLDRNTLRQPFFAQCYVAAPAAMTIGIGTILGRAHSHELQLVGALLAVIAVIWYVAVEGHWLKLQTGIGAMAAIWAAFCTWLAASLINSLISLAVLGL